MMRTRTWALGLLSSASRPKGHDTHNAPPPFFSIGRLCHSSRGKNTVFQDPKYRELEGVGELMRALNACLDTQRMRTTRFSTSIGCSKSLRGSATSSSCQ